MRLIVFFDLPTETAKDRRNYTLFRKLLIKEGFIMMQESIYVKLALNNSVMGSVKQRLQKGKPPHGLVQMLTVTEKQYASMEMLVRRIYDKYIERYRKVNSVVNINILGYENKIEFGDGHVNVLEVSDKNTFTNFVSAFNELCNNEKLQTTEITLHGEDNKILKFSEEVEIVIDIFNIELNSKKILAKLYSKIEANIQNLDEIIEQTTNLRTLLYGNIDELPFNFNIDMEISIQNLLKLYNVKIDTNMYIDFIEKLTFLIDTIAVLKIARILVIPNLKTYLTDEKLIQIYKYAMYKDVKLLLIENDVNDSTLKYEKKLRIDETFDDIVL